MGTADHSSRTAGSVALRALLLVCAAMAFAPPASARAAIHYESLSVGSYHNCAVKTDDTVACWGYNVDGQAAAPSGTFKSVSAGYSHTCALKSGDTITCWGSNSHGQTNAPSGAFLSVSAGDKHTCALRPDSSVACWGSNEFGQINAPSGAFTSVSAGGPHTCALRLDGSIACWGFNRNGQANPPSGAFYSVDTAVIHTCAVRVDDSIACWGGNADGQTNAPAGAFVTVSAGGYPTCALRPDGGIACWGRNDYGQIDAPAGAFQSVGAGTVHGCALRADGTISCWGQNFWGQTDVPDDTAPVVAPHISGTLGDNDWYTSAVDLDWEISDDESEIGSQQGCDPLHIDADQPATSYTCTATSRGGTESQTVSIPRDATAPAVSVTGVSDGASYPAGAVPAAGCDTQDAMSGVAEQATATSAGGPIGQITVTCAGAKDNAGNTGSQSVRYTVLDETDPTAAIDSPLDGQSVARNQVVSAQYTCADEPGGSGIASCTGTVPVGAAIDTATLGHRTFSVTATDGAGNTTTVTAEYIVVDATAPTIDAVSPGPDGVYEAGATIVADYSCSDEAGGSGLATCAGSVPDGQPIDTSLGTHLFTINASDNAGNLASQTINYAAADRVAPRISISSPMGSYGLLHLLLSPPRAQFSCADDVGASGLATCAASVDGRPVANGAAVPTGFGSHTLTVTAGDNAGNTRTQTTTYTIGLL